MKPALRPSAKAAARALDSNQETFYQRVGVYLTIVGLIVAVAAIFFKK